MNDLLVTTTTHKLSRFFFLKSMATMY